MGDNTAAYTLRGGEAGYQRLLLLARSRRADTEALFDRAGVGPGMTCIDIGCGGGEVTLDIARRVAPTGSALGIDMDEVKLGLAAKAARERGLSNARFQMMRVEQWAEVETYQLCYSRFLLQHLQDPSGLLRRMWSALRPGGLLIVEDVDWEGFSSDPPNPGLEFLRDRYIALLAHRGCDARIGRRLYRIALELGMPEPEMGLLTPLYHRGEVRQLAPWTLDFVADAMIADGVATAAEVADARASLQGLVNDPRSMITGPKIFQLLGRKTPDPG
ncbi:MAG TPA: methyltransferase domain-containing protein [Thermoplasmata archaeon]|nr:methyltransferase domain-containing protein [Thermoplasmata archaeon]